NEDGVAADLHRKLCSANHRRPNSLSGIPDRRQIAAMRQRVTKLLGEIVAKIAEIPRLSLVEIFGDAAGKRHGIDAAIGKLGRPALGDQEAAAKVAALAQIDHARDQARHAQRDALALVQLEASAK